MKRNFLSLICIIIISVTFCSCGKGFDFRKGEYEWELEYFGEEIYSELHEPCSEEDREELQPLLDDIEKAFSSIYSSGEEAEEELGFPLYGYAKCDPGTVREEHNVKFLTGKIDGDSAYLWISYWSSGYDFSGKVLEASGSEQNPVKARFTAEKQNGEWVFTGSNEHP